MGDPGTWQNKDMWIHKMSSPQPDHGPMYSGPATKSIKNKHLLDHKFDSKPKQAMHTLQSAIGFKHSNPKGLFSVQPHDQEHLTHENRHIHNLIHSNQQKAK